MSAEPIDPCDECNEYMCVWPDCVENRKPEPLRMPTYDEIQKLCCEVHVCFPPRPSYCLLCHETDPAHCPHPELQKGSS